MAFLTGFREKKAPTQAEEIVPLIKGEDLRKISLFKPLRLR